MALFLSTFINKVDKKGRVSIPASFRAVLTGDNFSGFVAYRSHKYPAVEGYTMSRIEKLSAGVDNLDVFSQDQDDLAATIFADAQQIGIDGDGRIILPQELRDHAGINEAVAFVGRGATFQLWQPEAFKIFQDKARQRVAERQTSLRLTPTEQGG